MVYSPTKEIYQYHFPKTITSPAGVFAFTVDFYQTVNGDHFTFFVHDEKSLSDFYVFNLDLSEYDNMEMDREYNYTISASNKPLERGLFRLGRYTAPKTEYNTTEQIIQYNG